MIGRPSAPPRRAVEAASATADLELIRAVAGKDRQAFKTLYDRYAPRIGSYLLKLLKRPELVDEAVNDTLLAVWQNADRYDATAGQLSTWLFGIAHHKGLKVLRQAGRSRAEIPFAPEPLAAFGDADDADSTSEATAPQNPERTVMGWELGRALQWALDQLSPEHRSVIELTFAEERSYPEIAAIAGCPVNTVKTRMFHARKKLAQLLAGRGYWDSAATAEE